MIFFKELPLMHDLVTACDDAQVFVTFCNSERPETAVKEASNANLLWILYCYFWIRAGIADGLSVTAS